MGPSASNNQGSLELGKLVRRELERLGGLWIKTAHAIASRRDVFPNVFCDELARAHECAVAWPGDMAKNIIERELGCSVDDTFREFDVVPVATSSIGQVHVAWLRKSDIKVAIKIQHPRAMETFAPDLAILTKLSNLLQFLQLFRWTRIDEIQATVENIVAVDLDYRNEANAMRLMRRQIDTNEVYVPKVFSRLCSPRLLVMEFVDGVLFPHYLDVAANHPNNAKKWCRDNGIQPRKLLRRVTHGDLAPFLAGRLSGGLRPGNVMMLRNNRVALIDFGAVGALDKGALDKGAIVREEIESRRENHLFAISTNFTNIKKNHAQTLEPSF